MNGNHLKKIRSKEIVSLQNGCAYPPTPGLYKMGLHTPMIVHSLFFSCPMGLEIGKPLVTGGDDVQLCSMICNCLYTLKCRVHAVRVVSAVLVNVVPLKPSKTTGNHSKTIEMCTFLKRSTK